MKFNVLSCLLLICPVVINAQSGNIALLNEVKAKLENHSASVSELLTDKKYASLHPETAFRELIEANAGNTVLKITATEEPGKKIRVLGVVTDNEGKPVEEALVYLYQTDARGWYAANAPHVGGNEGDMRHARIFGYVRTDKNGKFELHTIKPSGYPRSDLPAHICTCGNRRIQKLYQ